MSGVCAAMAELLYGAGLRRAECASLRVRDLDSRQPDYRPRGKGTKDRVTVLPPARADRPGAAPGAGPGPARTRPGPRFRRGRAAGGDAARLRTPRGSGPGNSCFPHQSWRSARLTVGSCAASVRNGAPEAVREAGRRSGITRASLPHAAPLLRDAPARIRARHPHGAGVARSRGRLDDDDLHARAEPAGAGNPEPVGCAAAVAREGLTVFGCAKWRLMGF